MGIPAYPLGEWGRDHNHREPAKPYNYAHERLTTKRWGGKIMLSPMIIWTLVVDSLTKSPIVIPKEIDGERTLPIWL